ncbi:hypothetical protein D3C86_1558000 [compost metagenome]
MIELIKERYKGFPDAVISEIFYKRYLSVAGFDEGVVEVYLRAENIDGDYEIVKLIFSDIISFRFIEIENSSNLILNGIFLEKDGNVITCDFFPLIYNYGVVENKDSDFMIKCKSLNFEISDHYSNGSKFV